MIDDEKKYERDEIERLFFQMDNLLHTRVNSLLVAETIFFVVAATVWKDFIFVAVLCILGVSTTMLFTITNLKLYWRVIWLMDQMKRHSPFYRDYLRMLGIRDLKWGPVTSKLLKFAAPDVGCPPRWLDTGWLYTWGLCIISLVGWISLIIISAVGQE